MVIVAVAVWVVIALLRRVRMELKYGYWINIILFRVKRPFDWLAFFTLAGFLYIEVTSFIWLAGFVSVKLMLWGERAV